MSEQHARDLGGIDVSPIGLGCLSFVGGYGPTDEAGAISTIRHALDAGVNLIDTADFYGPPNELNTMLGKAIAGRQDKPVLSVKTGVRMGSQGLYTDARPDYLHQACDASLTALGTDRIDLYVLGRSQPDIPIEESVGAMAELVAAGKVAHIGLSEIGPKTLRRAHTVYPITALQTEYSLWERHVEESILAAARELGTGFMAYSPLGRGFLTGSFHSPDDLAETDRRRAFPRFQGSNFARNHERLEHLRALSSEIGATPSQVALAWLLTKGDDIVPIPGTRRAERVDENVAAADLRLSEAQAKTLDELFPAGSTSGTRYPEEAMAQINPD